MNLKHKKWAISFCIIICGLPNYGQLFTWPASTARPIEKNNLQLNSYFPSRFGIRRDLEINSKLHIIYPIPNLGIKKAWLLSKLRISTLHTFTYYSPVLEKLRKQKNNLLLSYQSRPSILGIKNTLELSRYFKIKKQRFLHNILTLKASFQYTANGNSLGLPGEAEPLYYLWEEITYFPRILGTNINYINIQEHTYLNIDIDFNYFWEKNYSNLKITPSLTWYKNKRKKITDYQLFIGCMAFLRKKEDGNKYKLIPIIGASYIFSKKFNPSQELFIEDLKY